MRVCSPQIRLACSSRLGGGVYNYEMHRRAVARGIEIDPPHFVSNGGESVAVTGLAAGPHDFVIRTTDDSASMGTRGGV